MEGRDERTYCRALPACWSPWLPQTGRDPDKDAAAAAAALFDMYVCVCVGWD